MAGLGSQRATQGWCPSGRTPQRALTEEQQRHRTKDRALPPPGVSVPLVLSALSSMVTPPRAFMRWLLVAMGNAHGGFRIAKQSCRLEGSGRFWKVPRKRHLRGIRTLSRFSTVRPLRDSHLQPDNPDTVRTRTSRAGILANSREFSVEQLHPALSR